MSYSLVNNNYQYSLRAGDILTSLATGCSGYPYAVRHWEQSQIESTWFWHKMIAVVEFMPILGGIVALVERVAFASCYGFSNKRAPNFWRPRPIEVDAAKIKMERNLIKAHQEHFKTCVPMSEFFNENPKYLKLTRLFVEEQSYRSDMEDARFYLDSDDWALAGVFDGHGGKEVSNFAQVEFQERFPKALKELNGNIHAAFEQVIHQIHSDVAKLSKWDSQGTTCAVSYIDKKEGFVYTATVGDSEAIKISREGKCIPLSCVRNWHSKQDLARLKREHGSSAVEEFIRRNGNPKHLRSRLYNGVNLSRSIGDVEEPALTHKPKITRAKIEKGDVLIIGCDGLFDFVDYKEIQNIAMQDRSFYSLFYRLFGGKSLAHKLVDTAINRMNPHHCDNVTVGIINAF